MSRLAPALTAYREGGRLRASHVATLRLHFERTIRAGQIMRAYNLIASSHRIVTRDDIDQWLAQAAALGIFPIDDPPRDTTDAQQQAG